MKLDPTCPVEILDWEPMRDDRAHIRVYLRARCCAGAEPVLVEGCVRWIDGVSKNYIENSFSMDGLHINDYSEFTILVSTSHAPDPLKILAYFTRVLLSDGTEWTGGAETLRSYPDQPQLPGHLANALSAAAGPDAVCCAQELERGDWLCVCGRWNDADSTSCTRCMRDRREVLARFDPESVERLSPGARKIDIVPPLVDFDAPAKPVRRASPMRRVLMAVLLAALFACLALGVRSMRYEYSRASGLMPTSDAQLTNDI